MEDTTFSPPHPLTLCGICAIKPSDSFYFLFHSSSSLSVFVLLELRQLNTMYLWRNEHLQLDISTCSGFFYKNLAYITQIPN